MNNKRNKFIGPIVNVRYIRNRSKTGRTTTIRSDRAINYVGYGHSFENPEQRLRGQWYSASGAEAHDDVAAWSHAQATEHKYTFTMIVSVRDGQMQDNDFLAGMRPKDHTEIEIETEIEAEIEAETPVALPTEWRLMVHRDSNHDHAHVVFFRDKTMRKGELAQLSRHIQQELSMREQQRLREVQPEQGVAYDL